MQLRIVSFASFVSLVGIVGCSNGSSDQPPESPTSSSQGLSGADAAADAAASDTQRFATTIGIVDDASAADFHAKVVKHAQCMRAHGVDWPDPPPPDADGGRHRVVLARRIDGHEPPPLPADDDASAGVARPRLFVRRGVWAGDGGGGAMEAALEACKGELPAEVMLQTAPAPR